MRIANIPWKSIGAAALFAAMSGCATDPVAEDTTQGDNDAILGGRAATEFPEAAFVNFDRGGQGFICSGAVIAPKVVLTGGHCVAGGSNFKVIAPFANGQISSGIDAKTFDYTAVSDFVDPNAHDVGLVFLDQPIQLAQYPTIATSALPDGGQVVNVGRIDSGSRPNNALFVGRPVSVSSARAASSGFPFDYQSELVIEGGDSGGPDFIDGTHTIAAVNSGILQGGQQILARVDLVSDFIAQEIAAHGGGGDPGAPPDPGNPPDPGTPPEPPPAPPPPPDQGGGGGFCYALGCDGAAFTRCFGSEAQYCSSLCSEQRCGAQAQFFCSAFCN